MVACRECVKFLSGSCSLIWELEEARLAYIEALKRSLRLFETRKEYKEEIKKLKQIWIEKRRKQLNCLNKREFQYQKLGYDLFMD